MWPIISVDFALQHGFFPVITAFTIIFIGVHVVRRFFVDIHLHVKKNVRHSWTTIDSLSRACYCNVCEALLMEGFYCDCCGVCVNTGCIKIADKIIRCKVLSLPDDKGPMKHHWVKGNISLGAVCDVCEDDCGTDPGLFDYQCCWCQRAVHSNCMPKLGNVCDFGSFRNYTIPPQSVELLGRRASVSNQLRINQIKQVSWPDWSPIIILANRNSGNNDAGLVLSMFRRVLNPIQVIDLSIFTPEVALEWCTLIGSDVKITFLVAGGDGTVAWVLNMVYKMKVQTKAVIGIIPLGTGNDLSRVLGWGKAFVPSDNNYSSIFENVQRASVIPLDRWTVSMIPQRHMGLPLGSSRRLFMYNYLSVGVDAQVTLDFHRTRESPFYIFSSRLFNKVLYMLFGTQQVMERMYQDLDKRVELYLDGERKELPSIESIVVLNISSWGAGVDLWSMGADNEMDLCKQDFGDGTLEVVAVYSSFHIAQLQVGLSQPHRIGQAKSVKIKLKAKSAVQVDGEPWVQNPEKKQENIRYYRNEIT
ncbi:diacylglycerol kinase epsilon isoform X2 [Lycorma delicatula]|uniref:diacylglycerol kinase epsilon isoform X2 n=1 Tax=Lycorma delicatula TaxID=130591 RepID=UPI003F513A79